MVIAAATSISCPWPLGRGHDKDNDSHQLRILLRCSAVFVSRKVVKKRCSCYIRNYQDKFNKLKNRVTFRLNMGLLRVSWIDMSLCGGRRPTDQWKVPARLVTCFANSKDRSIGMSLSCSWRIRRCISWVPQQQKRTGPSLLFTSVGSAKRLRARVFYSSPVFTYLEFHLAFRFYIKTKCIVASSIRWWDATRKCVCHKVLTRFGVNVADLLNLKDVTN